MESTQEAVEFVRSALAAVADPAKAGPMAAYLKTDQPFYGVQKPDRTPIVRELVRRYPPADRPGYEEMVRALWSQPHREEQYVALGYARSFADHITAPSVPLYRDLIVEGAWWDLVDEVAPRLVGGALDVDRDLVLPTVRSWIDAEDRWLRRSAIVVQLRYKDRTDTELLSDACTANLADPDFFIRKAVGWALRQYARTDPTWVRTYVAEHEDQLSPLSRREAMKHL